MALTFEEICEIMGCEPSEVIECGDGFVMEFHPNSDGNDLTSDEN